MLLFYRDSEIIQNGNFVKVGKFDERGRVAYHNDLGESLIVNASKAINLIYQMYLKAKNSYEHDIRVEEYPFAERLFVRLFTTSSHTTVICTVLRYRY